MSEVKVKDYIIDTTNENIAKSNSTCTYEIMLENDMDFVIRKVTARNNLDFVFLISQDLYYIKNNNKEEEIVTLNISNYKREIRKFFNRINENYLKCPNKVKWISSFECNEICSVFKNSDLRFCIKNGINLKADCDFIGRYSDFLKKHKKLTLYAYNLLKHRGYVKVYNVLSIAVRISEYSNYNNAKYFVDSVTFSGIGCNSDSYFGNDLISIIEKYNLNVNTLIEYLTYGFISQGINTIGGDGFWEYKDYLNMEKELNHGKLKNKYPKYLKTEHDKHALKLNILKSNKQNLLLIDSYEENKHLEYNEREYSIVVPKCSRDIVDEGLNLSHCVVSYIDRVANKLTLIVFLRNTSFIDESLITIEVKNSTICQVKGLANRPPSNKEVKFIEKWARVKNLKIAF